LILNRVRKEIKIRPGFTPQEDVKRFRGTRQAQMDVSALPKGHIIGWAPPSSSAAKPGASSASAGGGAAGAGGSAAKSKAAKKNEKRKEKRAQKREESATNASAAPVRDDWEDDDDEQDASGSNTPGKTATVAGSVAVTGSTEENVDKGKAKSSASQDKDVNNLTDKIEKLAV
jgi:partner of Y14 and mago